jgi:opine dehydrogenase
MIRHFSKVQLRALGVPAPTLNTLIHLGSLVSGIDYWKTGSSVEKLGLERMTAKQIVNYVNTGEK